MSRRTSLADVDLAPTSDTPLPDGYNRASIPVDAWAADLVGYSRVDAVPADHVGVKAMLSVCELIAVWALPHPDKVVIGYEEHLSVECAAPTDVNVAFVLPRQGLNSEGAWSYPDDPLIVLLPRIRIN